MTPENNNDSTNPVPLDQPMPDATPASPTSETPTESTSSIEIPDPTINAIPEPQALGDMTSYDDAPKPADPTETQTTESSPADAAQKPVKKNNGKLIAIIIAVLVLVVLVVLAVIFLPKLFRNNDVAKYDDDVFFVEESNGSDSYAIFKNDGTRVTEFVYSGASQFSNGHAVACALGDYSKCGVVTAAGTQSIEFGRYDSLSQIGSLFVATKGEQRSLVTYADKTITKITDDSATLVKMFTASEWTPLVIYNDDGNHYKIFNADGEVVKEFESDTAPTFFHSAKLATDFIFAKNLIMIIDATEQKIVKEFSVRGTYELVKDTSHDGTYSLLAGKSGDEAVYAYYHDGDITEITVPNCEEVLLLRDSLGYAYNYAACYDGLLYAAIAYDGKTTIENIGPTPDYVTLNEHYKFNYFNSQQFIDFYTPGKNEPISVGPLSKKLLDDDGAISTGYYPFMTFDSENTSDDYIYYFVYDREGNLVKEHRFDEGYSGNGIYGKDDNGNYLVKDREGMMIINDDDTVIIEKSDSIINVIGEYYLVNKTKPIYKEGNTAWRSDTGGISVMNAKGELVNERNLKWVEILDNGIIRAVDYDDGSYVYFDSHFKEILVVKTSNDVVFAKNYISVKDGSKYTYYNPTNYAKIYAQ